MRVAAVYDVHGNLPALEAVLEEVERAAVDLVVSGGDAFLGPMPRETYELLRGLGARVRFVRGNTDRSIAAAADGHGDDPWQERAVWCAAGLGPDGVDFLRGLPTSITVAVPGLDAVCFCHATPRDDEEIVTSATTDERLERILAGVREPVVVAGHTHSQFDRVAGGTRFVNAGSVGMPYEHEPGAYWALLGPDVELRRTGYDAEAAAARFRATGFPDAEAFVREHVLSAPSPAETAPFLERLAVERDQSANSEKYR